MVFLLNNLFNPFPILVCQSISIHTQPTSKVTVQHERVPKSFSKKKGKKKKIFFPFLRNYWYLNGVSCTIVPCCMCLNTQGIPTFHVKLCFMNTHQSEIPYPSLSEVLGEV